MGNTMAAEASKTEHPAATAAKGTISFEITGYWQHKGHGVGRFIRSASLNVGGLSWCLNYYPDGDTWIRESRGSDGIYLELELLSRNARARAAVHMRLVNQQETAKSVTTWDLHTEASVGVFSTVVGARKNLAKWGVMLKTSDWEKSPYLHNNDSLLFECDITVFKQPHQLVVRNKAAVVNKSSQPLGNDLTRDLAKLLESKDGADVIFDVQGQVFPAHTVVLAMRSPVFKAQFHGPMRQQQRKQQPHGSGDQLRVTIEDIPPEAFKALLHFIYTDSTHHCMKGLTRDDKKELTMHLLVAADRYDVEKLKFDCETYLSRSLDVENAATVLVLADRHNCNMLKSACIQFISCPDNRTSVVASEGYRCLRESCPDVLEDLFPSTGIETSKFLDVIRRRLTSQSSY